MALHGACWMSLWCYLFFRVDCQNDTFAQQYEERYRVLEVSSCFFGGVSLCVYLRERERVCVCV